MFHEIPTAGTLDCIARETNLCFSSSAISQNMCGYGSFNAKSYAVHVETGTIRMDPAFTYQGLQQELTPPTANR
jgi:hypothetical protein